jgi:uncharacterized protein YeaO (DUF488 family)
VIRVVRLGTPRELGEGLRIGAVRRPPRGVRKHDYARLDYYDAWLPELSPPPSLVSWAQSKPWTDARWSAFARRYRAEMRKPEAQRMLALLAALSHQTNISVGCYCENESRCHRSLLRELLVGARADVR